MSKKIWRGVVLALGVTAVTPAIAHDAAHIQWRTQHSYTVKTGDTLWGIAGHFLVHPWQWPTLWKQNTYIKNPNLIYPGETIVISDVDGRAEWSIAHTVELTPHTSVLPLPTVHREWVMRYIGDPGVISIKTYAVLPYIAAASESRPVYSAGDVMYTVGLHNAKKGSLYQIVDSGKQLFNPVSQASMGYILNDVGTARVIHGGHHAAIRVTMSKQSVYTGDKLIPFNPNKAPHYFPSAPTHVVNADIIGKLSSEPSLTVGQAVIIDAGSNAGLVDGNVLHVTRDRVTENAITGKPFNAPPTKIGEVMVFRVFPTVSYAVITTANGGIQDGDSVVSAAH